MPEITLEEALKKAVELEERGYAFYQKSAETTGDEDGKAMFKFLAGEEINHVKNIRSTLAGLAKNKGIKVWVPDIKEIEHSIFDKKVAGWGSDEKSDALAALNIGIAAERNSIELYGRLDEQCKKTKCTVLFRHLLVEEEKHLAILEKEVEFVTETGEYHDFKTITF